MAKRILAVVTALVLSLSMLTVFASAADQSWAGPTLTQDEDTPSTLYLSWHEYVDATSYKVALYKDGTLVGAEKTVSSSASNKNDDFSVTYTKLAAGKYEATVQPVVKGQVTLPVKTKTAVTIYGYVKTTNVTVEEVAAGHIEVTWKAQTNTKKEEIAEDYRVDYTYVDADKKTLDGTPAKLTATGEDEYTAHIYLPKDVNFADVRTVTVAYHNSKGVLNNIGSVNVSTGTSSSGSSSSYDDGAWFNGTTLYWTPVDDAIYYYVVLGGTTRVTNAIYPYNYTTLYTNLASVINQYSNYSSLTFDVYAVYSNYGNDAKAIARAVYYRNGTSNGTVYGYVSGGTLNLEWSGNNYYGYQISYRNNSGFSDVFNVNLNYASVPIVSGATYTVTVYALNVNGRASSIVGTVYVDAYGRVTYGNTSSSSNKVTGTTEYGSNCMLVVGTSQTQITWYGSAYGTYEIIYQLEDSTSGSRAYAYNDNSAIIPVGSGRSFTVLVLQNGQVVASASHTAKASSSTNVSSSNQNLVLTEKNSSTTTVTWEKVDNASVYRVQYFRLDSNVDGEILRTSSYNSADIPLGKNISYQVVVYAVLSSGRETRIGTATHKAGDAYTSTSAPGNNNTTTTKPTMSEYVTGLKATSGNKKVTLKWNEAANSPTYEVYWKRANASEWKKAGSTTKRTVNISGLSNGTSYDFKIRANGKDSGIVTISPSSSDSVTRTAPDPDGATAVTSKPEITSISGGSGSITVSWNPVKDATTYQVWISIGETDGKTTYAISTHSTYFANAKTSINGTTATITGLPAGTYKVRIKASSDGTKFSSLNDCAYKSVTVK